MSRQRPLPKDTHALVDRHLAACENLGLVLDKFQPWDRTGGGRGWDLVMPITERRGRQLVHREAKGGEAIGLWFKGELWKGLPNHEQQRRAQLGDSSLQANGRLENSDILAQARARWQLVTQDAAQLPPMWTTSPLAVGLGQSTTLETAVTLHPLYGFPYIPGSSVKGVTRATAFYAIAEQLGVRGLDNETYLCYENDGRSTPFKLLQDVLEADDKNKWPDVQALVELQKDSYVANKNLANDIANLPDVKLFRQVFGWLGQAGQIVFYDAIPAEIPHLGVEVMTPHFPKYYSQAEAPTDADSPNPVTFLTVAAGTQFLFAIGGRNKQALDSLQEKAREWLQTGLGQLGLGSKTSSGYGFFWLDKPYASARKQGEKEIEFKYYVPTSKAPPQSRAGMPPSNKKTQSFANTFMDALNKKQGERDEE